MGDIYPGEDDEEQHKLQHLSRRRARRTFSHRFRPRYRQILRRISFIEPPTWRCWWCIFTRFFQAACVCGSIDFGATMTPPLRTKKRTCMQFGEVDEITKKKKLAAALPSVDARLMSPRIKISWYYPAIRVFCLCMPRLMPCVWHFMLVRRSSLEAFCLQACPGSTCIARCIIQRAAN